jgi:MerR family transcriptional regulator, light-induced transcriptional regulator
MQDLPLATYTDEPIYNMKAVTQRTGIPAATLRAWERRYHALAPRRSEGNYRLYSERDIAVLRWLQGQLDAGLSISRAVVLLERMREHDLLNLPRMPMSMNDGDGNGVVKQKALQAERNVANWDRLVQSLHDDLMAMDEQRAASVLGEAYALYTVEDVCIHIMAPCLVQIGEDWFNGKSTVVQEHFATSYLIGRLMALFNAQRLGTGPLILVGCAPGERHELGALMMALMLRRAGHNVRYLGADIPLNDLVRSIQELQPRVVSISAALSQAAARLEELPRMLKAAGLKTHLVLGGRAFSLDEKLGAHLNGDYIGTDLNTGIKAIERLLGYAA